jgi:CubicO group peptidase (beta-lactamase class C family)
MLEMMSVTKSVVALLVGRLVTEGTFDSADVPLARYIPEWRNTPKAAITLQHVLNHTSGLQARRQTDEIYRREDVVRFAIDADLVEKPGTAFRYNNRAYNLLPAVIERATGASFRKVVRQELLSPLGITAFEWQEDPSGNAFGMSGMRLFPTDLLRFGQLVAQQGQWEGHRLIDCTWFRSTCTDPGQKTHEPGHPRPPVSALKANETSYDRGWWLKPVPGTSPSETAIAARGYLGQYLIVYPSLDLVAARVVRYDRRNAAGPGAIRYNAFEDDVRQLVAEELRDGRR